MRAVDQLPYHGHGNNNSNNNNSSNNTEDVKPNNNYYYSSGPVSPASLSSPSPSLSQPLTQTQPLTQSQTGRAQVAITFYETRKKRKSVAYFWGKPDEEICWESWTLDITCATPRTESGRLRERKGHKRMVLFVSKLILLFFLIPKMRPKSAPAMEKSLQKAAMKIINIVNMDKDHIPPIMTGESNPFPYQITVNPKLDAPKKHTLFGQLSVTQGQTHGAEAQASKSF